MSGSGTRSLTGCYTCRLRKKKCDETHPACRNCLERSIPCYGYGVKPAWMDGKGGEAEYVKAIRKAAERNYRARRRGLIPSSSVSAGDAMPSSLDGVCEGAGTRSAKGGMVGAEVSGMEVLGEGGGGEWLRMGGEGMEEISVADDQEQDWGWETGALGQDQLMLWDGDLDIEPQCLGTGEGDISISLADKAPLSLRPKAPDDEGETTMGSKMIFSSRAGSYQPSTSSAKVRSSPSQPLTRRSQRSSISPQILPLSSLWYDSSFAATLSVRSSSELDLLMHYLDNVFCLQFGFSCLKSSRSSNPFRSLNYSDPKHSGSSIGGSPASDNAVDNPLDRGRGWYLNTLLKCRPLYFATLSISAWHQQIVKAGDVAAVWAPADGKAVGTGKGSSNSPGGGGKVGLNWEAERNFVMTLKGLQGVLDELNAQGLRGVELMRARWMVLGTMCQVLSLEVFRTLGGNWPIHIRAARTFLSMIGSSSRLPLSRSPKSANSKNVPQGPEAPPRLDILEQVLTDDKHQILTSNDTAALKHFVTSFIWVDILSRASGLPQGPPTSHPFDYLPLLENNTLDLSHVMGCENWVFIGIAQIILLEFSLSSLSAQLAGAGASTRHDPNALDLRSQAAVLEVMFERGIRDLLDARSRDELSGLELHSSLVTELFALAALTYLHAVVAGAYPWLPQIRSSAARSLAALEALPAELLIRVSWPFAVTGCMVLEEKRGVVRGVVASARSGGWNVGTVWKGWWVVEECWRLRDAGGTGVGEEVSWVHAMGSLGERILLC